MKKIILMSIIAVFLINLVSAANVGVSPANVVFENVLRGGYAERPIIVTADSQNDVEVEVTKRGEIADWIEFSESDFSVSRGQPNQFVLSVTPPVDMPNGNYTGFVTVKMKNLGEAIEGHATGLIIPTLDVYVIVQVTDQEFVSCRASNFNVESAEIGDDIVFSLDILNTGNVRLPPQITLDIWDQESINIVKQVDFDDEQVTPTKTKKILIRVPSGDLEIGQYWVDVSAIECYASQTLTFDVLEEGALRASGKLHRITAPPWAEIDDIVPLSVIFENNGEKPLEAKFSGKIMYNNKIIQLLESEEPEYVPMDNQTNLQFYFTPKKAGKYIISGRVFYDKKRTYEQSAVVNVKPNSGIWKSIIKSATYIILVGVIIVLLFKIREERKSYFRKIRRMRH